MKNTQNIQKHKALYRLYKFKYTSKFRSSLILTTVCGSIGIIIAIFYYLCKNLFSPESISRIYTDNIFYYINMPLKTLSRISPFSIGELLLYIAIIFILYSFFKMIVITVKMLISYHIIKKSEHPVELSHSLKPLASFGFRLTSLLCVIVSIFILFGGINYTGLTYSEKAGLISEKYTTQDLKSLCIYLGSQASNERKNLKVNFNNAIDENYPGYNPYKLAEDAQIAYKNIPDYYGVTKREYPNVKYAFSSQLMSNLFITGIYPYVFPEAIVNIETPIMALPHTICHEMAHQRGFAREDEANFISYLACINSENPLLRYSGYYTAFSYAMEKLYIYDNESWNNIFLSIDRGVILDINRETAYWDTFHTTGSELTQTVNNAYLSAMGSENGTQSYGQVVDLLIADAKRSGVII